MTERAARLRGLVARARPDASVLERALRGDPVAFSEAYRRYYPRVYAFCLSRVLDPHVAEDAAQEAFVRFINADPDSIESPKAWLFTVARNASIDHLRRRDRVTDGLDDGDDAFFGSTPDSAEELLRHEQGRHIMLALRRLRPRYRTALVMRELHHMSSEEMSLALETTPGAVDTLVSRARDAFGVAYGEVCELPDACASAFPLIYKEHGSGLEGAERARLEAHVDDCPRCREESARARKGMGAVLPFLVPLGRGPRGLLGRLLATTDPAMLSLPVQIAEMGERGIPALKVAVVALAVAVTAVPLGTVGVESVRDARAARAPISAPAESKRAAARSDGADALGLQASWQRRRAGEDWTTMGFGVHSGEAAGDGASGSRASRTDATHKSGSSESGGSGSAGSTGGPSKSQMSGSGAGTAGSGSGGSGSGATSGGTGEGAGSGGGTGAASGSGSTSDGTGSGGGTGAASGASSGSGSSGAGGESAARQQSDGGQSSGGAR